MMTSHGPRTALVVGAGPTGLTAAIGLRRAGIDVRVVDAVTEGANTSRAAVIHPRTLEVLEPLGVVDAIGARALRVPRFDIRDGARSVARLSFGGLPTRYPWTSMISQADTESILRDRLAALDVAVEWDSAVTDLAVDDAGRATVRLASGETARPDVVVGADGMHSTVRKMAGIGFPGSGYEQSFVLADVSMDWPVARDTVSLTFAPDGLAVVAPLPDDRFRVVATLDDAPRHPTASEIEALLTRRGGSATVHDVAWSGRFHVHHRLAETYHRGSVVLVGDAAHVHSPAGGQGMNIGVQDAVALAETVTAGGDLGEYEKRRRPVARRVLALTDRMTRAATTRGSAVRHARNGMIRAALSVPPIRRRAAMELSELTHR
ncbi:MAG: FAD-dependent monooxygenase [Williamsia herbipolensis]|nr:FAD-dependent monooxygenase [Williamsia herbipolensis]